MIKLFVGLGNPGNEYADTRHNAGFWLLDAIAENRRVQLTFDRNFFGNVARTSTPDGPLWLLTPQTYMNRSGQAVSALARYFKINPDEILVAHDELDLPPGQAKLKKGGGHGGHNGLRDIHAQLGTADYWRLRIGIGHPGHREEVVNWVLNQPSSVDRDQVMSAIQRAAMAFPLMQSGDTTRAMNLLNTKPPRNEAGSA